MHYKSEPNKSVKFVIIPHLLDYSQVKAPLIIRNKQSLDTQSIKCTLKVTLKRTPQDWVWWQRPSFSRKRQKQQKEVKKGTSRRAVYKNQETRSLAELENRVKSQEQNIITEDKKYCKRQETNSSPAMVTGNSTNIPKKLRKANNRQKVLD